MNLLFVDCCISQRGGKSRTARLCAAFLDALEESVSDVAVEHLDLTRRELRPFDVAMLDARDALFAAGAFEDDVYALARQFRDADAVVVGAPFWDLSFPAQLRIYLEHISANGVTYYYDERGPHGSCKAQWLAYLTSGGDFERDGSIGVEYWRQLCGMYGIPRYEHVFAGGLDIDPSQVEPLMANACGKACELAKELARVR